MTTDLTLASARTDRDALAGRTDVLGKVGVLCCLPDDMHVTTDMLAEFYGAPMDSIRTVVKRNREEFGADGMVVVTRAEFEERFKMNLTSSASSLTLYPRRAVLRMGMLLRDSAVARQVRDYLLGAEGPFLASEFTEDQIVHRALHILDERVKELIPKAEAYDHFLEATGRYSVGAVAKMLGTSQNKLFRELRNRGVLIAKGAMRNTPYQQYMHHFEVKAHEYERTNGEIGCSYTTYVQPSGVDFIRRKLDSPAIDPVPAVPA